MLEGEVTHEEAPSSVEGSDVVVGRVTGSSSMGGWDNEDAAEEPDQVLIYLNLVHVCARASHVGAGLSPPHCQYSSLTPCMQSMISRPLRHVVLSSLNSHHLTSASRQGLLRHEQHPQPRDRLSTCTSAHQIAMSYWRTRYCVCIPGP